jgi:hypothetical protein
MQRKISLTIGLVLLAAMAACAKKPFTVISDTSLIQNPGEKQVVKVPGGELRRGEVVQLLEEKDFGGKKFYKVQIEKVATKGWVEAAALSPGKLASASILKDTDFYSRPSLKSPKAGKAKAGVVVFIVAQEEQFAKVQYPGGEAYIEKSYLGDATAVVRQVVLPGFGTATVSASSTYKSTEGKEDEYDVRNLFDGSLKTGWCEGKNDDNGVGETITLVFDKPVQIDSVSVVNGLTASQAAYKNNNRVSILTLEGSDYGSIPVKLEDGILDFQLGNMPGERVQGSKIVLRIDGVHAGKVKDTCMSEIRLIGGEPTDSGYGGGYSP